MNKIALVYIPVIHKGYLNFIEECKEEGVEQVYVIGDHLLGKHEELDYINRKDRLRAISTDLAMSFIESQGLPVSELTETAIKELQSEDIHIVTPNEDISDTILKAYFPEKEVTYHNSFLRWNRNNVGDGTEPDSETISLSDFQKDLCAQMILESEKSADWWRQVGAVLVKDGEIVYVTHNEHMPEEQSPNIDGDTRALFKKGIHINYGTAAHAEVAAIGAAAREGIGTEGAELYVTDFPCPYCARLIAKAGIKKVYFMKGYAVLEGDEFLRGEGVTLVRICI